MKKELLKEMLNAQFNLNSGISGPQWVFGTTNKGKLINWSRYIYMETAELIESYPYKHWKSINGTVDSQNVKIEFIDIWHFIMSMTIEYAFDQYIVNVQKQNPNLDIKRETISDQQIQEMWDTTILDTCVTYMLDIKESEEKNPIGTNAIKMKVDEAKGELNKELVPYEELLLQATILSSLSGDKRTNFVISIISTFFIIQKNYLDIDIETIYYGKMTLNQFRQDHGYKEGSYVKMWPVEGKEKPVEDNVVMFSLADQGLTGDDLYAKLKEAYPIKEETK